MAAAVSSEATRNRGLCCLRGIQRAANDINNASMPRARTGLQNKVSRRGRCPEERSSCSPRASSKRRSILRSQSTMASTTTTMTVKSSRRSEGMSADEETSAGESSIQSTCRDSSSTQPRSILKTSSTHSNAFCLRSVRFADSGIETHDSSHHVGGIVVQGAGSSCCNGVYLPVAGGRYTDRRQMFKHTGGRYTISHHEDAWTLAGSDFAVRYGIESTKVEPPEVGWCVAAGAEPAPTLIMRCRSRSRSPTPTKPPSGRQLNSSHAVGATVCMDGSVRPVYKEEPSDFWSLPSDLPTLAHDFVATRWLNWRPSRGCEAGNAGVNSIGKDVSTWRCMPQNGLDIDIRKHPSMDNAERTGHLLEPGIVFNVVDELLSHGILYLRLGDGRGWVFDRTPHGGTMCVRVADDSPRSPESSRSSSLTAVDLGGKWHYLYNGVVEEFVVYLDGGKWIFKQLNSYGSMLSGTLVLDGDWHVVAITLGSIIIGHVRLRPRSSDYHDRDGLHRDLEYQFSPCNTGHHGERLIARKCLA